MIHAAARHGNVEAVRLLANKLLEAAATEKAVALAKTPEARVAALHRASALRAAMETATHERERELRRERVVAAMGARRKEGPMDEDEKWLV